MGSQGKEKGKQDPTKRPESLGHALQWFSVPSQVCKIMHRLVLQWTSASIETDGQTESSMHIGKGGADSAWEGNGK